jgi:tetratricopeptide (TPR) repeat protein
VFTRILIITLLSFVALSSIASAQSNHSARPNDRNRAVVLFERSESLYKEGKFSEAAVLLRQAYELEPEPILLYNMGRALESDGQLQAAAQAFQEYLRTAKKLSPPERRALQARIRSLQEQIQTNDKIKQERDQAKQRQEEAERRLLEQAQVSHKVKEDNSLSPWPWVVLGVGAAGLATGGILSILASGKYEDAENEPIQEKAQNLLEEANGLNDASVVFLIAGGVVAAGGLTWALIDVFSKQEDDSESSTKVSLGVTPTSVWLSGTF